MRPVLDFPVVVSVWHSHPPGCVLFAGHPLRLSVDPGGSRGERGSFTPEAVERAFTLRVPSSRLTLVHFCWSPRLRRA